MDRKLLGALLLLMAMGWFLAAHSRDPGGGDWPTGGVGGVQTSMGKRRPLSALDQDLSAILGAACALGGIWLLAGRPGQR